MPRDSENHRGVSGITRLDFDYTVRRGNCLSKGNATTILGWKSEPQPDGIPRILPEFGGRTSDEGGYVHGAPELVVEVSKGTRYIDLGPKLDDYERGGILEYVVRAIDPDEIYWYGREQGALVQRTIGDDGLYRSTVFPVLSLDRIALLKGETRRLRGVADLGCATPEHAAFELEGLLRCAERTFAG